MHNFYHFSCQLLTKLSSSRWWRQSTCIRGAHVANSWPVCETVSNR